MTYIEGFIMPVPVTHQDGFIRFSAMADELWTQHGANRILECWPDDSVPSDSGGFSTSACCRNGEIAVFSWIEWQDKATRDRNMPLLEAAMQADPRFDPALFPLPFDNDRVVSGCFRLLLERGEPSPSPYVQGFVFPIDDGRQDALYDVAERAWARLGQQGACRLVLSWQDDFPDNRPVDFPALTGAGSHERTVFAFVEWPSREAYREHAQPCGATASSDDLPFNRARMLAGCFIPLILAT